jgi:hypothetical protein
VAGIDEALVAVTIGFWVPPTSTFSWISCGELGPIVVDADGNGDLLDGPRLAVLGSEDGLGKIAARNRRLADGDRLVLASEGVLDRTLMSAEVFGTRGSSTPSGTRRSRWSPAPSPRLRRPCVR